MRVASVIIMVLLMPFLMAFIKKEDINTNIYSKVTDSPRIMQALDSLNGTSGEWAKKSILGDNITGKPIRVEFKNLSTISPDYTTFDALGWKDESGQLYIFVNTKHEDAPIEALGSILCHESIHQDQYSSIDEETYGWGYEADVWIQMKKRNPELCKADPNVYPLVFRLNTLEKMFKDANYTTTEIKQSVASNPGYKDLPESSPGFGDTDNTSIVNVKNTH